MEPSTLRSPEAHVRSNCTSAMAWATSPEANRSPSVSPRLLWKHVPAALQARCRAHFSEQQAQRDVQAAYLAELDQTCRETFTFALAETVDALIFR